MKTLREQVQELFGTELASDPTYLSMRVFGDEAEAPALAQVFGTVFRVMKAQQEALLLLADELDKLRNEPHD